MDKIPSWKRELILRRQNKNQSGGSSSGSGSCMLDGQQTVVQQQQQQQQQQCPVNVVVNVKEYNLKYSTYTQVIKQQRRSCSGSSVQCDLLKDTNAKMVQESTMNDYNDDSYDGNDIRPNDDNDLENLQYGPGIVNKLRNRYMSLALRATNPKTRPGLYRMRNATSFEHLLDDNDEYEDGDKSSAHNRFFESHLNGNAKNVAATTIITSKNRYKKSTHGDLKRARSEEAISTIVNDYDFNNEVRTNNKRETIHEDTFIFGNEGNIGQPWKCRDKESVMVEMPEQKKFNNNTNVTGQRYNRPLRVQPIMNEKEKPPANFVKQTKLLYEKKPDLQPKGEVANKIAAYKSLLQNAKKKPTIPASLSRQKPLAKGDALLKKYNYKSTNPPSPNVMPDLLLSSPITSPTNKISPLESFIKAEVENAIPSIETNNKPKSITAENGANKNVNCQTKKPTNDNHETSITNSPSKKPISMECRNNIRKAGSTLTYDFSNKVNDSSKENLQQVNSIENQCQMKDAQKQQQSANAQQSTRIYQQPQETISKPLIKEAKQQIAEVQQQPKELRPKQQQQQTKESVNEQQNAVKEPPQRQNSLDKQIKENGLLVVKDQETKLKSFSENVNDIKTLNTNSNKSDSTTKIEVPKKKVSRVNQQKNNNQSSNTIVFNFTQTAKDVPDYIGNDGRIQVQKIEKPKVGEGGIIILPGVTLNESVLDDDWKSILEGPPSPCDIEFVNDSIIINGRSSFTKDSNKKKLSISFHKDIVDEIYEYPSEDSLSADDEHKSVQSSVGQVVPTLSGSTLGNYTPKSGYTIEEFQLGVTRTTIVSTNVAEAEKKDQCDESVLIEYEPHVVFSAGTNSDILF